MTGHRDPLRPVVHAPRQHRRHGHRQLEGDLRMTRREFAKAQRRQAPQATVAAGVNRGAARQMAVERALAQQRTRTHHRDAHALARILVVHGERAAFHKVDGAVLHALLDQHLPLLQRHGLQVVGEHRPLAVVEIQGHGVQGAAEAHGVGQALNVKAHGGGKLGVHAVTLTAQEACTQAPSYPCLQLHSRRCESHRERCSALTCRCKNAKRFHPASHRR